MNNINESIDDSKQYIKITDVTLREWDQAPLTSFNANEKAMIALMLSELWVDVIEVWFWFSREDFKNIKTVAKNVWNRPTVISSLWRALKDDTIASLEALEWVKNPRIHIFLAMSKDHIEWKFNKNGEDTKILQEKLLLQAKDEILRAVKWSEENNDKLEIEFSPEDATWNALVKENWKKYFRLKNNPDFDFLIEVCEEAIISWATIINVPDTLWNLLPRQTYEFFKELTYRLEYLKKDYNFKLSCHIHNDLALSSANAIEAIRWWSEYVETTMLWIWERAWNTKTEQILWIISEKWHDLISWKEINLHPKIQLWLIWPISDFVKAILWFDKSLQEPFIWALSNIDWSWVHNASSELYWWSKNKAKYWWANMPEFFSPRGWVNQIVWMLKTNWIELDKNSAIVKKVTEIAAKKSEEVRALYANNIYSIYLECVKNFHIKKLEIHNNELEIIIRINWDTLELKWKADWANWVVKTFIQLINNYLWKDIVKVKDLSIKSKANIHQEYEKFKKRVSNILSDDFKITADKILEWTESSNKYSDATAISQIVLDIDGEEITSIAWDNNVSIANIKAILDWVIVHLVNNIKN